MTATVTWIADAIDKREQHVWDARARARGFADFAALAEWCDAEFERRFTEAQNGCTHADKHPDLGMCEDCAQGISP